MKNKKISFLIILAVLILPTLASAQTLASMASSAMQAMIAAVGFVVVILWLVTGILFLTAVGSPEKLKAARIALFAAIAGTVIIIIAQTATDFVGNIFGLH